MCFLQYFLKLSGVNGSCSDLRNTDKDIHKTAKTYQKTLQKYKKTKHDVNFLNQDKHEKVFPKFVQWKNIKLKYPFERNHYFNRNLNGDLKNNAIKAKKNCYLQLLG